MNRRRFLKTLAAPSLMATAGLVMPATKGQQGRPKTIRGTLNLGNAFYYTNTRPWIDLMKSADVRWSWKGVGFTADSVGLGGWLERLPSGRTYGTIIFDASGDQPNRVCKPGTYYCTFPPIDGVTVRLVSLAGGSNGRLVSPGRSAIDIDSTHSQLSLEVVNASGSPQSISGIKVYHEDDEAKLKAEKVWQDEFFDALRGATQLRFMDWTGTNVFGYGGLGFARLDSIELSDFVPVNARTYEGGPTRNGIHPTVIGQLCAAAGIKRIHIALPGKVTYRGTVDFFQALKHEVSDDTIVLAEYNNEAWNAAFTNTRNYLLDVRYNGNHADGDGTPLSALDPNGNASASPDNKIAAAYADGSLATWKAAERVFGRSRVVRVISFQAAVGANPDKSPSTGVAALMYVDPGFIRAGARVKDLVDQVLIAPYFYEKPTSAIPASAISTRKGACEAKVYNKPDGDIIDVLFASIEQQSSVWTTNWKNYLATKAPNATLGSYECGQHVGIGRLTDVAYGVPYSFTVGTGNKLVSVSNIRAAFEDGEEMYFFNESPSSQLSMSTRHFLLKVVSETEIQLFFDQANYNSNTLAILDGNRGTTYTMWNYTRVRLLEEKFRHVLDTYGGQIYQRYKAAVFDAKLESFSHFVEAGGYGGGWQWGLKRSQYEDDAYYQRAGWFRTAFPVESAERRSWRHKGTGSAPISFALESISVA